MKIRIFKNMVDDVYRVVLLTEDWSEGDIELMFQFGEPEVNVGGDLTYTYDENSITKELGDEFVRVLHGFPYARRFDSRDYEGGHEEAVAAGSAWSAMVIEAIEDKVTELRAKAAPVKTEEVVNV